MFDGILHDGHMNVYTDTMSFIMSQNVVGQNWEKIK